MQVMVHGGAGRRPAGCEEEVRRALLKALDAAFENEEDALAAAVAAVVVLEDEPCLNAGTGSALNRLGGVEMDAAVMAGEGLKFGAVAAIREVKNPVLVAREVMDSEHILLSGEGAVLFARERGFARYPEERLITERALSRWREAKRKGERGHGTVGAVVRDRRGRLAAATSTGGIVNKRPGRVGDTPLPGAGTYAEAGLGAASATGEGEFLARALVAYRAVSALIEVPPEEAAARALALAKELGGEGGLILVDAEGRLAASHTSPYMAYAWRGEEGEGVVV